jgi:tetratricopeptide (TPR) repeat protein
LDWVRASGREPDPSQHWLSLGPRNVSAKLKQSRNHLTWTGDVPGALALLKTDSENALGRMPMARGALLAAKGDFAAAIADYNQARGTGTPGGRPGSRGNHIISTTWVARLEARAGNALRAAERYTEALAAARQFVCDLPDLAESHSGLAVVHAGRGAKAEMMAARAEAMRLALATRDASFIALMRRARADAFTLIGEKATAIGELRAMQAMGFAFGYRLRRETEWESLRGEPKFQQLMKEAEALADAQPRPKKQ